MRRITSITCCLLSLVGLSTPLTSSKGLADERDSTQLASTTTSASSDALSAQSWPSFRGTGSGYTAGKLPVAWSEGSGVKWVADIPGGGWASAVVVKDRIFVTTAVSEEFKGPKGFGDGVSSMGSFYMSRAPSKPISFELHCVSLADGKPLWSRQVVSRPPSHKIHPSNSYATETPVSNGEYVVCYFGGVGTVACFDMEGESVWSRDLGAYKTSNNFGTGSALAINGNNAFVQCDNDEGSFLLALEVATGKELWKVDRSGGTSWSSPVIWENENRTELIVCGSDGVTSYNLANGQEYWQLTGTGGAFSASPAMDRQRVYFGQSGRTSRGPLIAVNARAAGKLTLDSTTNEGLDWVTKSAAPGMCSPVVAGDRVYVMSRSIISSFNTETGERIYRERVPNGSSVTSSLWANEENLYVLNEGGETTVIGLGDEFTVTNTNKLPGLFWATPSVAGELLLLRSATQLFCIAR